MNIDRLNSTDSRQDPGKGWASHRLSGEEATAHASLSYLKESLMAEFGVLRRGLPNSSESSGQIRLEYLKAAVRSIVRYSCEGGRFAQAVSKVLLQSYPEWGKCFLTPPYLIFHLSNDRSEPGSVHSDIVPNSGQMLTWWTPINNRQLTFAALTIFNRSQYWLPNCLFRAHQKLGRKILSGDRLLKLLALKKHQLVPEKKSSYFWFSRLLHYGNENVEDEPHCALVFRISERPLYYEPSNTLASVVEHQFTASTYPNIRELNEILLSAEEFARVAPDFQRIDTSLSALSALSDWIDDVLADEKLMDERHARHVSFALALVAQRFPENRFSAAFNLMSFLLGKENLVGLERFLAGLGSKSNALMMTDVLRRNVTFDTYQDAELMYRLGIGPRPPTGVHTQALKLHQWI